VTGAVQLLMGGAARPLSASASPSSVSGSTASSGTATTNATTCTASGGLAPYTYAWSRVSGDTSTSANSATSAATTFSASVGPVNSSRVSVWKCTVTDALGHAADSNTVSVDLEYTGP
jgi:hypothetical protein